ncbi:MAG: glutathione S-transferase N-terminal domain-containing protein [Sedimentisphaerales bacterium]|jgi:glutaredoxin
MITFYRTRKCPGCAAIQDTLEELCIAHETVVLESPNDLPPELASAGHPPILVDEHDVITGSKNIIAHLEKLEKFKELWYKYQSDACYCDD